MSWHEEFLSENNKKPTISTMGDLFKLIEEVYEVEKGRLFKQAKSELQILKEQFLNERKDLTLTLQAIPEIAVSELGWTNLTGEAGDVSGPERRKLEQFLSNIQGNSFQEKILSLANFYDDPDAAMVAMFGGDAPSMPRQIAAALGYLTFFKTLTKVISNFNAASAGFNFEAFLAVLSGGEQVKANTGTIADFIARIDGTNTPISLKLYQEGKLHVGGSFTDLANDLADQKEIFDYPFMRYLAVTKQFDGGQKEGLDINGKLRWFQFDFTLENVFDILAQSSAKSRKCIMLPKVFISGETPDFASTLPGSAIPSPEKLEQVFVKAFAKEIAALNKSNSKQGLEKFLVSEEAMQAILANLNWSTNDSIFAPYDPDREYIAKLKKKGKDVPEDFVPTEPYISRGDSVMPGTRSDQFKNVMKVVAASLGSVEGYDLSDPEIYLESPTTRQGNLVKTLAIRIALANNGGKDTASGSDAVLSVFSRSKLKDERLKRLNKRGTFATIEESLRWYNEKERTDDERKLAIKQCYGYLTTEQFNLNQPVVEKVHTLSKRRTLPEGQSTSEIATLFVGNQNTQNMLNKMTGLINEAIFGMFVSIKEVQENSYAFMAGGLQQEDKADEAIRASNDIITKTRDLKLSADKDVK